MFKACYLSFIVLCLFWVQQLAANLYHRFDYRLENAMTFIDAVQQPDDCTGLEYLVMDIGINGGFAAQFQLAAKEWMHLFAAYNFSVPVLIQGRIIGYSDNKVCDSVNHAWTCYFQPMSECEDTLRKTGKQIAGNKPRRHSPVPDAFEKYGFAFWWGAVQYKMFQLQPVVIEHIHAQASMMNRGFGFPFGLPLAGLHVRHGDKRTDGFKEHSMEEELNFLRRSPDCAIMNIAKDCFAKLNTSSHASIVTLHRLSKKHGIVIPAGSVDLYNRTSATGNAELALDPKSLFHMNGGHGAHHHAHVPHNLLTHNVTSGEAPPGAAAVITSPSPSAYYVIPVQLFVASDDIRVLASAARQGYLTDAAGVSQDTNTANEGAYVLHMNHFMLEHEPVYPLEGRPFPCLLLYCSARMLVDCLYCEHISCLFIKRPQLATN